MHSSRIGPPVLEKAMISFKHTLLRAALFLPFGAIPFSVLGQGALNPSAGPAPLFKSLNEIQPRTAVAGGGATTISQPGSYYLTGNITVSSGNGITVTANHVSLDLNGFTVTSTANPPSGTGILLSGALTNISICNGFIFGAVTNNGATVYGGSGFANGVSFTGNQPVDACVTDLSVSGVTGYGIYLNSNVGYNTGNTAESCLVNNCGGFGILADKVFDCSANVGTASAIFSGTASRTRGVAYSSEGVHAALTAENCSGQSTSFYGMDVGVAAINCFAQSSSSYGLYCNATANVCYGQTSTGLAGISTVAANNCYGYHMGSGGGYGLYAVQIANGCLGQNGGITGYGLYCTNIVNSSCGNGGGTATYAGHKYNTP